ncbi:hypothetical protein TNCV_4999331 [Trichonephila clavipes]|nr:hypothetical protein TNCV_4999331 [Trichonephila clavipes]
MNPHRPEKPASDEYTTDEEEMIVYDVEDEIESNPDYVKENPPRITSRPVMQIAGAIVMTNFADLNFIEHLWNSIELHMKKGSLAQTIYADRSGGVCVLMWLGDSYLRQPSLDSFMECLAGLRHV